MFNNTIAIAILMGVFFVMILCKLPITFSLCCSTGLAMLYTQIPLMTMVQQMAKAVNSFSLMAIPFFLLAGEIMGGGGISDRMLNVANALVGRFRGGLCHVNILASMLFGSMSGSAVADISSLGSLEIPMMEKGGYDREFATAVTVASSCQGVLIPPSHNMIIYSLAVGGVSVGALFMGGILPGVGLGLAEMILCYFISIKRNYPKGEKVPFRIAAKVVLDAIPALMTVVIILGGVLSGLFTATESAAIACVWAFLVSTLYYKELKIKAIPGMLMNVVKSLAMVFSLIAAAAGFGWMMAYLRIPEHLTGVLLSVTSNKFVLLLLINIMLLVLGCIMDMAPLILICAPILLPVVQSFGMSSIQFGIMIVFNLAIGLTTPPVGGALFMGCSIGKVSMEKVTKAILPLYASMLVCLLLVTYVPFFTTALPALMGYAIV